VLSSNELLDTDHNALLEVSCSGCGRVNNHVDVTLENFLVEMTTCVYCQLVNELGVVSLKVQLENELCPGFVRGQYAADQRRGNIDVASVVLKAKDKRAD